MNFIDSLTAREFVIADLIVKGLTNNEIAKDLNSKDKTVRGHITNIYKKYGVKHRMQFIVKVFELNYKAGTLKF